MTTLTAGSRMSFDLPDARVATAPPETRGVPRDGVKLLVAAPGMIADTTFSTIGDYLAPGDLLIVNTSATMPAALRATRQSAVIGLHLSTHIGSGRWIVELRRSDRTGPILDGVPGEVIGLAAGGTATLIAPVKDAVPRLWRANLSLPQPLGRYLRCHGEPIRYSYMSGEWPLDAYQTVFSRMSSDGVASAEMPSAARPFTTRLVTDLIARGIAMAPITLHAGVSSQEAHETPYREWFDVPASTARMVSAARSAGGRIVAVGTTATRAIESAWDGSSRIQAARGWTDLVLGPERPAQVVDGIITGWHPPQASHLLLLEAVAGRRLVAEAYSAALEREYLWHEFGDSCLLLPDRSA